MREVIVTAILYYLPAVVFAAILVWMNLRISSIAKNTRELLIQSREMVDSLREIQKLLENRKS